MSLVVLATLPPRTGGEARLEPAPPRAPTSDGSGAAPARQAPQDAAELLGGPGRAWYVDVGYAVITLGRAELTTAAATPAQLPLPPSWRADAAVTTALIHRAIAAYQALMSSGE